MANARWTLDQVLRQQGINGLGQEQEKKEDEATTWVAAAAAIIAAAAAIILRSKTAELEASVYSAADRAGWQDAIDMVRKGASQPKKFGRMSTFFGK